MSEEIIYILPAIKIIEFNSSYKLYIFLMCVIETRHIYQFQFEELITSYGLFPLISKVTHTRPNCRGTCIGNILTTEPINVNLTGIIEQSLSHHSSVFVVCKIPLLARRTRPMQPLGQARARR